MSMVADIEAAIKKLSKEYLSRFRDWFLEFDANAWDRQFERDVGSGKLDSLAEEALSDLPAGRCSEL